MARVALPVLLCLALVMALWAFASGFFDSAGGGQDEDATAPLAPLQVGSESQIAQGSGPAGSGDRAAASRLTRGASVAESLANLPFRIQVVGPDGRGVPGASVACLTDLEYREAFFARGRGDRRASILTRRHGLALRCDRQGMMPLDVARMAVLRESTYLRVCAWHSTGVGYRDYAMATLLEPGSTQSGGTRGKTLKLRIETQRSLQLEILAADGRPAPNVPVRLWQDASAPKSGIVDIRYTSDDAGRIEIPDLVFLAREHGQRFTAAVDLPLRKPVAVAFHIDDLSQAKYTLKLPSLGSLEFALSTATGVAVDVSAAVTITLTNLDGT